MGDFKEFELGQDDSHLSLGGKRWQGVKDQTDRFSFIMFPGLEEGTPDFSANPRLVSEKVHYFEGVGYIISDGPEYIKLAGDQPRSRAATLVIEWPTTKDGEVIKERLTKAEVKVLILAGDKYKQLVQTHRNFHLGTHDVTALCTDSGWQKVNFGPCGESLLQNLMLKAADEEKGAGARTLVEKLMAAAQAALPEVINEVGRKMDFAALKEKLSGGDGRTSVAGNDASAADVDIDDAMDDLLGD